MDGINVKENDYEEDVVSKKESFLTRLSFVLFLAVAFLIPIFVLPLPYSNFSFNKQFLFASVTVFAGLVWLIDSLRKGEFHFQKSKLMASAFLVAVVTFLSSVFSGFFQNSFFGQGFEIGTAFSVIIGMLSIWLIPIYFNNKDRVFYAYLALIASFSVVALYQVSRLFLGPDFLSFGIFTTSTSNLVGKWYDLGIVFGLIALFSIIAGEFLNLSKVLKVFTYIVFAVSLGLMAVVNFSLSWIVLGFFSLVIGIYIFSFLKDKRHSNEDSEVGKTKKRFPIFPVVSFVICALFVVFGSSFGNVIANRFGISQLEVRPNMSATLSVASGSLKDSVLLGSGPNRFVNQWLLHKDPVVNQSIFWGTDFSYGFGLIPTYLVTTGILGILAWVLFMFFFLKVGIKSLFKDSTGWDQRFLLLSSFVSSLFLWIMSLIYVPSNTVFYLTFFVTGLFLATCANTEEIPVSVFKFSGDSRKSFVSVFLVIVLFVGGILVEYSFVKKYSANLLFQKGVLEARNTGNLDKAESYIGRALALYENDLFYRTLTEIGVARIGNLLSEAQNNGGKGDIEALRNRFQGILANTVAGAKKAIEIDSSNYENYVSLGGLYSIVYQYGIKDAYGFALSSYQSATNLNPQNPGIDLLLARLEILAKNNDKARSYISSAISKKPNYTEAVFLLSQLESSEGNVKAAIQSAESATLLSPNDPTAFFQLGLLKFDNKDFKGAVSAFEQAVALNPVYANAKYFLGLSYEKIGRNKDAIVQFEQIKVSNPDNKEVDLIISNLKAGRNPLANNKDQKPPEKRNTLPVKEKGDLKSSE